MTYKSFSVKLVIFEMEVNFIFQINLKKEVTLKRIGELL